MTIKDEMKNAILHDIKHKAFRTKHIGNGRDLDTSADRDAARMSRHPRAREEMTGEYLSRSFFEQRDMTDQTRKIYSEYCQREYIDSQDSAELLHMKLLGDKIIGNFNEITSMPFTSLKYHTLLVCTLHWNYKQGRDFQDLYLHCATKMPDEAYSIVFQYDDLCMFINDDPSGAKIGAPAPFFGQTVGRLYNVPLPEFMVDNLRRFRSWSTGLQYLEDALAFMKESG
ncbi:MAG: hypothetical protein Q8N79_08400 [Candidatus Methanoperedens sp.]|nr:hypothetical protein [Candidatus Methanoperedens sp.]